MNPWWQCMIKTVKDLIEALSEFESSMPICIRKGEEEGCFSDWQLHEPTDLFPGGMVCLSAFVPIRHQIKKVVNDT